MRAVEDNGAAFLTIVKRDINLTIDSDKELMGVCVGMTVFGGTFGDTVHQHDPVYVEGYVAPLFH